MRFFDVKTIRKNDPIFNMVELAPPGKSVELEDPGAHELGTNIQLFTASKLHR